MAFRRIARVEEVPPGRTKYLLCDEGPVVLANVSGEVFALSGTCQHQHKSLEGAALMDYLLDCPWHHFQYDVRTGINHFPRNVYPRDIARLQAQLAPLATYPVEIRDDQIWVDMEMTELAKKRCVPCTKGTPALKGEALRALAAQVHSWRVIEEHHLSKTFLFPDFARALDFVNRIGAVAEQEGHHPDICFTWGRVDVKIFTHKIDGLSESDFILAAKINESHDAFLRG